MIYYATLLADWTGSVPNSVLGNWINMKKRNMKLTTQKIIPNLTKVSFEDSSKGFPQIN